MPIPSPGTYDVASQASLLAVKAKTDLIPASPAAQAKLDSSLYTTRLTPVHSRETLVTATLTEVDIQPPAGETWVIFVHASIDEGDLGDNTAVQIGYFDGTNMYGSSVSPPRTTAGISIIGYAVSAPLFAARITNTMYIRIRYMKTSIGTIKRKYSYWGWKE